MCSFLYHLIQLNINEYKIFLRSSREMGPHTGVETPVGAVKHQVRGLQNFILNVKSEIWDFKKLDNGLGDCFCSETGLISFL